MSKIMVVDDEAIITTQLEESLKQMGYDVVGSASSGEEAIEMAKSLKPDLILMDIVMPGKLDGINAAKKIKTELDIPPIFLTAYTDDKFIKRAKNLEPLGYLVKPINMEEVRATIEVALHKKDIERRLHELVEKYRSLISNINYAIFSVDSYKNITFWNNGAETIFGYKANEVLNKPIISLMAEGFREEYENEMNRMILTRRSSIKGKVVELNGLRKDGSEFPFEFSLAFWNIKGITFFTCIGRDITERKQMEEELRNSREKFRNFAAHIQFLREKERTIIAHEMHDKVAQTLAALETDLYLLDKKLPKDQEFLFKKTKSISSHLDEALQTVKRIYTELRPSVLDDLGLAVAIDWQAQEFQKRTGIKCEVNIHPKGIVLDKDRSTVIFRIFQEVLTNVAKHSKAKTVKVSLRKKNGKLELKVKDDGKGIRERQLTSAKSYGIIEIRERVRLLGGEDIIEGIPNKGTTVTARIPLKTADQEKS